MNFCEEEVVSPFFYAFLRILADRRLNCTSAQLPPLSTFEHCPIRDRSFVKNRLSATELCLSLSLMLFFPHELPLPPILSFPPSPNF